MNYDEHLWSWKVAHGKPHKLIKNTFWILPSPVQVIRSTLHSIHCSAAGLQTEVLRKHWRTVDYMDKMEAIICTIKATLREGFFHGEIPHVETDEFCQEECVKRRQGVHHAEARAVSRLRLRLPRAVWHTSGRTEHFPRQNGSAWLNDYANQQPCAIVVTSQAWQATMCYSQIRHFYSFASFT